MSKHILSECIRGIFKDMADTSKMSARFMYIMYWVQWLFNRSRFAEPQRHTWKGSSKVLKGVLKGLKSTNQHYACLTF